MKGVFNHSHSSLGRATEISLMFSYVAHWLALLMSNSQCSHFMLGRRKI